MLRGASFWPHADLRQPRRTHVPRNNLRCPAHSVVNAHFHALWTVGGIENPRYIRGLMTNLDATPSHRTSLRAPKHTCHARGCKVTVPPRMFMCKHHWFALPERMRRKLWSLYVPGQERTKTPTPEYIEFAQECVDWIANVEGTHLES